jgi:hypothetical protein
VWLVQDRPARVSLTRREFEEVAKEYLGFFEALVRGALRQAEITPGKVSSLILTGGHSRWYFVDETLKRIFPHISRQNSTLLRHAHPEQSVARGLAYVPMVKACGARMMEPVRKSAHSIWVQVPNVASVERGVSSERRSDKAPKATTRSDEAILIMPRGHVLPFSLPKPIRISVRQLGTDNKEAKVRIQFFSGAGGSARIPLFERTATFERGWKESLLKRFVPVFRRGGDTEEDRFELYITCHVDENELLSAELAIVRYFQGKEMAVKRQRLAVNSGGVKEKEAAPQEEESAAVSCA